MERAERQIDNVSPPPGGWKIEMFACWGGSIAPLICRGVAERARRLSRSAGCSIHFQAVVLARVGAVGPDDHHVFYQPFLRGRTRPAGCAVADVSESLGSGRKEGQ